MNALKKYENFRNQLNSFMPDIDDDELKKCLNRIKHFKDKNRNIKLNIIELKLFRFLVMNSYKPETVYGWLLLNQCPEEVKEKYLNDEISYKDAVKKNKKVFLNSDSADLIIDEINWSYECFFVNEGNIS